MSQFPFSPYMDFEIAVGAGMVTGVSQVSVNGFSDNIDITPSHDIIPWADTYTWPSNTGDLMEIVSSNAADTSPITILGLDADFRQVTLTLTPNGLTPVQIPQLLTRVNYAFNSGTVAWLGNMTIRKTGAGATIGVILPDIQELQQAVYTIPRGKNGLVREVIASTRRTTGLAAWILGSISIRQIVAGVSHVFRRPFSFGLEKTGSSSQQFINRYPAHLAGPVDIILSAVASDNDTTIGVRVPVLLYNNAEAGL